MLPNRSIPKRMMWIGRLDKVVEESEVLDVEG